ncbi:CPBP family intramembrane glutamic endopeptidase [Hathewaya massiliensis]|uniref:CPBP family intramembrane glutamic endopeptidase n=1 Tax=Hathewaya massiliensis TaxID=1964382 RepID=UPI001156D9F8|nr:type II CAAX endopeptidase family protein [Hathewaya massiliensis]
MDKNNMLDKYYLDSFYYDEHNKKGILGSVGVVLIAFLLLILGELLGGIFYGLIYNLNTVSLAYGEFWAFFMQLSFMFGLISIVILFFTKVVEKLSLNTLGFNNKRPLKRFGIGFFIGFIMMTISTFILVISGQAELKWIGFESLSTVLIIIPAWIIQSSTEELLTRGYLFTRLKNKSGNIYLALIFQGAFFSFLHVFNSAFSVIAFIQIFVVGLLFAIYSLYEGSIWGACGMHAAWNWAQGNIFGWQVSGTYPKGGN